jgi:hypothetical protein
MNLVGSTVEFINFGGDRWRYHGTLVSLTRAEDGVHVVLRDVKIYDDCNEIDEPIEVVSQEEFVVTQDEPPQFFEHTTQINLPYVISHEEINLGLLYPQPDSRGNSIDA